VVLKQLSRLEGDRPRVAHRNELVTMATDELYAFLVHFLDVLFSLREYDTTGTREEQATCVPDAYLPPWLNVVAPDESNMRSEISRPS
jgi:hypothetical protein